MSERTIKEDEPTEADRKVALEWVDASSYIYDPDARPREDIERDIASDAFARGYARARAGGKAHKDHSPCALRVLEEFYDPEEAYGIAIECTCFPMDCEQASRQAVKFLADVFDRRKREAEG